MKEQKEQNVKEAKRKANVLFMSNPIKDGLEKLSGPYQTWQDYARNILAEHIKSKGE